MVRRVQRLSSYISIVAILLGSVFIFSLVFLNMDFIFDSTIDLLLFVGENVFLFLLLLIVIIPVLFWYLNQRYFTV